MKTLFKRMIGASRLDAQTYEQVEADRASTAGAVFVVVMASIAAAVGSGVRDFAGVISAVIVLLATWVVWVGLTYIIGTRLLPEPQTHADIGEMLRTTGFSASPGVLRILGLLPAIGLPIFIGITFWMLLTFVVAVRQALDYGSSGRALAVCLFGWLIHALLFFGFVFVAI
jgi:hypothetical protein